MVYDIDDIDGTQWSASRIHIFGQSVFPITLDQVGGVTIAGVLYGEVQKLFGKSSNSVLNLKYFSNFKIKL